MADTVSAGGDGMYEISRHENPAYAYMAQWGDLSPATRLRPYAIE
jgi:hypothetical protein